MAFVGPRERLLLRGAQSLSDAELLAVFLRTGHRNPEEKSNIPAVLLLAEHLLQSSGGLNALIAFTYQELRSIKGLGEVKASSLLALGELIKRSWSADSTAQIEIDSQEKAYLLFSDLAYEEQEVLAAAYLNAQNRVIAKVPIYRGTLTYSPAQPREILRLALKYNAAKILLAHNHPSQNSQPSRQDTAFTKRFGQAAKMMGVPLLDHLIVCRGGVFASS